MITALGPGGRLVAAFDGVTGARVDAPLQDRVPPGDGLFVSTAAPANRMVIDAAGRRRHAPAGLPARTAGRSRKMRQAPAWRRSTCGRIRSAAVPPAFLGVATLGDPRPDVGAIFGASYAPSGYHLDVTGLAGGAYDIVAFAQQQRERALQHAPCRARAHRRARRRSAARRWTRPRRDAVRPAFRVAGWAFDVGGVGAGSGIEAIHVWAFPVAGGSPAFVGAATLGDARPDVAALFGPRAANAGYHLDVRGMAAGDYVLRVYAKAFAAAVVHGRAGSIHHRHALGSGHPPVSRRAGSRRALERHVHDGGLGAGARCSIGAWHRCRARVGVSGGQWCPDLPRRRHARWRAA